MMPTSKKIVFWGRADLLDSSLESILSSQSGWEVVCVPNRSSFKTLNSTVEKTDPEIIIIRIEKDRSNPIFPMQLINDHPDVKVITLGFENNSLEVYSRHTIQIKQVSDLISVLEDNL